MGNLRLKYLDELKGLTIILMVLGHIYCFSGISSDNAINKFLGFNNMPLFMFISGYLCFFSPKSKRDMWKKIGKRCLRYMVPMLVVSWLLMFFLHEIPGANPKWYNWVLGSGYLGNWYWYLKVLIIFSILSIPLFLSKKIGLDILLMGCEYVLFLFLWKYGGAIGDNLRMEHATTFYPFFAIGMMVKKYERLARFIENEYISVVCLILFCALFVVEHWPSHLFKNVAIYGILPFSAILILWNLFKKISFSNSKSIAGLEYCGRYSLEIYLFHYFFIAFFDGSPIYLWGVNTNNAFLTHLVLFLIAVIISLFSIVLGKILHQDRMINRLVFGD